VRCLNIPLERSPQLCILKINIEVHSAHPLWYILLWKPLHLSITHQWAASYPSCGAAPLGEARLNLGWCSSILVGTPQPRLQLFYLILLWIPPVSALLRCDGHFLIFSVWIGPSVSYSTLYTPPVLRSSAWDQCWQRFRSITSGQVPGPTRTVAKLAVWVVNRPELSTRVRFDGKLPTRLNWEGCQRVAQRVHP